MSLRDDLKVFSDILLLSYNEKLVTVTTSGAYTFGTAPIYRLTLGGNHQLPMPSDPGAVGKSFVLILDCDGNTPTWSSDIYWENQIAPTLDTTSGRLNLFGFTWDDTSSKWIGTYAGVRY